MSGLDARILVLGTGGGAELKALAEAHSTWAFCRRRPSTEVLKLTARMLGPLAGRAELVRGYIDDAPPRSL